MVKRLKIRTLTNNNVINNNTNVRIGTRSFDPCSSSKAEIGIVRFYNKAFYSDDVFKTIMLTLLDLD